MSNSDDKNSEKKIHPVIPFPQSRVKPKTSKQAPRDLGITKMARQIKSDTASLKGHWCSRCKGIWYGCGGECECPVCGNRNG